MAVVGWPQMPGQLEGQQVWCHSSELGPNQCWEVRQEEGMPVAERKELAW